MEEEEHPVPHPRGEDHKEEPPAKKLHNQFEYQKGNTRLIRGAFKDPYTTPLGKQEPVKTYRVHRPAV